MAIILFPKHNDLARLQNSEFVGGPLCPIIEEFTADGKLTKDEQLILSEIENTVILIKPKLEKIIKSISFPDVSAEYNYYFRDFINWHDRAHFTRLCLKLLQKNIDDDVLTLMALFEYLFLSWTIIDEALDQTELCMSKETCWFKLNGMIELCEDKCTARLTTLLLANTVNRIIYNNIVDIFDNRQIGTKPLQSAVKMISEMQDNVFYSLYRDNFLIDIESVLNGHCGNIRCSELITEYFRKISLFWGSQFEIGLKVILFLFPDLEESTINNLAKIGNLWGQALKIRDDIVDLIGDESALGRKPFEDIILNNGRAKIKRTLPLILYLCKGSPKEEINKFFQDLVSTKDAEIGKNEQEHEGSEDKIPITPDRADLDKHDDNPEAKVNNNIDENEEKIKFADSINESIQNLQRITGEAKHLLNNFNDNEGKESILRLLHRIGKI